MPTKRNRAVLSIKDKQIIISHFYLIKIHIFDYPDTRLSGLFTEVPTSPGNRGSTVVRSFDAGTLPGTFFVSTLTVARYHLAE